jgi:hypothetical protein
MNVSSLNPQKKYGQLQSLTEVNEYKPGASPYPIWRGLQNPIISVSADI